jgi:hypothetical protein
MKSGVCLVFGFLLLAAPARADALATACMSPPTAMPRETCICLEAELRKVLTPDEMRIEILLFEGKLDEWRRAIDAIDPHQAHDFADRVNAVTRSRVCSPVKN